MPPDQFLAARGVVFSTPGTALEVSSTDTSALPLRFGNVDAGYPAIFQTFSGDQIFRAVGSNVTEVNFFLPGTQTKATTSGFAVAFADVDQSSTAKIEAFDSRGQLLGTAFAPPADNGLSFASLVSDQGSPIGKVRITSGTTPLGPGVVDSATVDVVAMDDFIFGPTQAASDLAVTVTDAPDPVAVGGDLTYTATVSNTAQGAAPTADVTAWLPAGVAAVSATASQGTCATPTTCALGSIAAGAAATMTVVARATAPGSVTASFAAVTGNDPNAANDSGSATTTVSALDATAPRIGVQATTITVGANGNVALKLRCATGEQRCTGTARLTTKVLTLAGRKLRLDLGSAAFAADGGKVATATIKLGTAERAILRAFGKLGVRLVVDATDAAGNRSIGQKQLVLKAKKIRK